MDVIGSFIINALSLLMTLGILVTIHEFGHFWVARRCGVKIECFSIGFGKSIYSWTRGETEYRIALLPLGGYVKMLGQEDGVVAGDIDSKDRHRAFNHKSLFQRSLIVVAGPAANFILAIFLYWFIFVIGVSGIAPIMGSIDLNTPAGQAGLMSGDEIIAIDGSETDTLQDVQLRLLDRLGETGSLVLTVNTLESTEPQTRLINLDRWLVGEAEPDVFASLGIVPYYQNPPALIGEVLEGGRAEAAGLQNGDLITSVNGQVVNGWRGWVDLIRTNPESSLLLTIDRDETNLAMSLTPANRVDENGDSMGYIGAGVFQPEISREVRYPFFTALPEAISETWTNSIFVLVSIKKMIIGLISVENLSGPLTIAQVAGQTASYGLESYINFLAILSISLGVLNLLPIPVLDGGHLFFYIIEAIVRRPIPEKIQAMGMQFGVLLIAGIMCIAFYNDLNRFF